MGEAMGTESILEEAGPPPWHRVLSPLFSVILFPQFLCMVEDNYPETLKRLLVIKGKLRTSCENAKREREAKNVTETDSRE